MLFNTFIYPFFLMASVLLFWLLPKKMRLPILLMCSVVFYGFNGVNFLVLIIILALFTYYIGNKINKTEDFTQRRRYFVAGIGSIVAVLLFFKYSNLIILTVGTGYFNLKNIILPLGISFFTFEFVHYLIEIYYRRLAPHTLFDFFSFALFFPTLASGPIKRFNKFFESTRNILFSKEYFITGIFLILLGYLQKYLVADNLVEQTAFLSTPAIIPSGKAILSGLFFYSFRIYFDFAGLSNIAIGSALLFGVSVPINFSWPYLRSDLASFWKYWHMSLTSWIRDYIYLPLVFRFRNNKIVTIMSVVITMAVIGLWHGASWNFLFFGLYHGIGLAILQMRSFTFNKYMRLVPVAVRYSLGVAATFLFVMFGWPFFVTSSLHDSILLYQKIFAIFIHI